MPTWTSSTAASSKTTNVHRRIGKKSQHIKNPLHRHQRDDNKPAHKKRAEYIPREPLGKQVVMQMRKLRPIAVRWASFIATYSSTLATNSVKTLVSFCPQKERFWFFVPMFCIGMDLFFLSMSLMCSMVGKFIYVTLLLHKLALLELLEFDSATISYILICFYPTLLMLSKELLPFEEYWTVFFRWFAVDRLLCRPIQMKSTFLSKINRDDKRRVEPIADRSQGTSTKFSLRQLARFIIRHRGKPKDETERVTMANQILLILRKIIPLILMIEVNVRRQGFLMSMSKTERILLGYGFAVIRSGYLFSPLIWMSWTLQLTVIMFAPSSRFWAHFLLIVGLSAIRLSHYTASVEDMEGIYVSYKEKESFPKKKTIEEE